MKDDLKYVMSFEDEFDEKCLILNIQTKIFKTQFESTISAAYSHVYENEMFEQNSSLESENCCLKKTVGQFQKDFSKLEARCINLELQLQNYVLKSRQHGQFLKEKSKEAKIKHDIDSIETINIKLEHSVAKLLLENAHLHKDNEHLKKIYKDLYDFIKQTRVQTKDHNDSLIAQLNKKSIENADLNAQIQEKVFAIAALKNELRKSLGNSVDTKFAKPSILEKLPLQPLRNQSVVRQPNAFKSERPKFSKPWFASQVDVNNNLSKPVTPPYWPNVKDPAFAKRYHVIASSKSRNNSKNMPRFSSNDMVHNHYIEKAKKKTHERDRTSKTSVMPSTRLQNTANGSKPKPRSMNQMTRNWPTHKSSYVTKTNVPKTEHSRNSSSFLDSKLFVCSTCRECVFNSNHDACITNLLKEVNSRGKKQSLKTTKRDIPIEKKSNAKKSERRISTGHKFSPNKSSVVYVKTTPPRSGLTWKPTGRIFTYVGLRWIPTRKTVETCLNTNDSVIPLRKETCSPNIVICANSSSLSAGTSTASKPISSKGSSDVNILSSYFLYKHSIFNYVRKYF
ncbi:hypothetical protein Tco_0505043 [Tanacetum coccineum]